MSTLDFKTSILVDNSPREAFNAINNVRGWWSEEIEGNTAQLLSEFNYRYEDVHTCRIKIVEFIPDERVVWLVMENFFKFTKDKSEWTGTKIVFEISRKGDKTFIEFTHVGLVPEYECYEICRGAWTHYINNSLYKLITTGKGEPNGIGKPQTADEERLGSANR